MHDVSVFEVRLSFLPAILFESMFQILGVKAHDSCDFLFNFLLELPVCNFLLF